MKRKRLDIGDRVKMILDKLPEGMKLDENTRMYLAGAIAFHMDDYSKKELDDFIAGVLV